MLLFCYAKLPVCCSLRLNKSFHSAGFGEEFGKKYRLFSAVYSVPIPNTSSEKVNYIPIATCRRPQSTKECAELGHRVQL